MVEGSPTWSLDSEIAQALEEMIASLAQKQASYSSSQTTGACPIGWLPAPQMTTCPVNGTPAEVEQEGQEEHRPDDHVGTTTHYEGPPDDSTAQGSQSGQNGQSPAPSGAMIAQRLQIRRPAFKVNFPPSAPEALKEELIQSDPANKGTGYMTVANTVVGPRPDDKNPGDSSNSKK